MPTFKNKELIRCINAKNSDGKLRYGQVYVVTSTYDKSPWHLGRMVNIMTLNGDVLGEWYTDRFVRALSINKNTKII